MDRTPFSTKMGATGDRFMPSRSLLQPGIGRHRLLSQETNCGRASVFDDLTFSKGLNRRNYVRYLDSALGLGGGGAGASPRVLNFSQQVYCAGAARRSRAAYPHTQTWPCRPRRRPYIGSADSVLDLPNYGATAWNYELVDWSRSNMLLAALGNKVYVWSWEQQSLVCGALASAAANCGKFNPSYADTIAVALESGGVETFTVETAKQVRREFCHCGTRCAVTALDWSPTGKSLVIGCSEGCLTVLERSLARVSRRALAHTSGVLRLRVSPDARYLASLALYDTSVSIWQWPHLKPYFLFENYSMVKSMAWHPWQSSMLAIGGGGGGGGGGAGGGSCVLAVWDVAPARLRQPVVKSAGKLVVDCMLFSHVTGEMVLSCWMDNAVLNPVTREQEPGSRVMVLSEPGTEVDKWCMSDRVNTMMFSPDGSKLAIATADEDLIILYYLPEEPKWKKWKQQRRNHSALAVMLDVAECGFSKR